MRKFINKIRAFRITSIILTCLLYFLCIRMDYNICGLRRLKEYSDKFTASMTGAKDYSSMDIGQKGKDLAFLCEKGLPVPEAFFITTKAYKSFKESGSSLTDEIWADIQKQIVDLENTTGLKFGDTSSPLLISVRSLPPVPMPGILATIINVGVNDLTVQGLIQKAEDPATGLRFAYDTYREFIENFVMVVYSDKVDEDFFINLQNEFLRQKSKQKIKDLNGEEMEELVRYYQQELESRRQIVVPQDAHEQLKMAIGAVFSSWDLPLAAEYRKQEGIEENSGLAIIIQRMVFGNMGQSSGSGIGYFGRKMGKDGESVNWQEVFYGRGIQGSEVMTPRSSAAIERLYSSDRIYSSLVKVFASLRGLYDFPQEVEFTVEGGKVYILQIRTAEQLLKDKGFLIPASFKKPEEVVSSFQKTEQIIAEKRWQIYRQVYFPDSSLIPVVGRSFGGTGAVIGKLCLSLEEVERVYASGGTPIFLATHRDESVIKAALEGKIAGLITTYGNEVMHEAIIAKLYLIPGVVISSDYPVTMLGSGEVLIGNRVLKEGNDFVVYGSETGEGDIIEFGESVRYFSPYKSNPRILEFNPDVYFDNIKAEYSEYSYEAMVAEHDTLRNSLWEKIRQYSGVDDTELEEIILLNLKVHFLHLLIEQDSHHAVANSLRTEPVSSAESLAEEEDYQRLVIGKTVYEVEHSRRIEREIAPRYGLQGTGIPQLGAEIVSENFYDSYQNEMCCLGMQKPLLNRDFLCMGHESYPGFGPMPEKFEEESDPAYVLEFIEFAGRKLSGRGEGNYLRINRMGVSGWTGHGGGMGGTIVFFGIDFPPEKLDEVVELLWEWELVRQ